MLEAAGYCDSLHQFSHDRAPLVPHMLRAYLDTEFTSLNRYTARLISLALVIPGGPEFYVELTDAWEEGDCSDFVRTVVIPKLDLAVHGRTVEQARMELHAFLQILGPVEIISDAPQWDWPLLIWLAGSKGIATDVVSGQIPTDIDIPYEAEEPPHHALLDARILAKLHMASRNPYAADNAASIS